MEPSRQDLGSWRNVCQDSAMGELCSEFELFQKNTLCLLVEAPSYSRWTIRPDEPIPTMSQIVGIGSS